MLNALSRYGSRGASVDREIIPMAAMIGQCRLDCKHGRLQPMRLTSVNAIVDWTDVGGWLKIS